MLLNEPAPTQFDWNFHLGRIPVRVHPAFLILPVVWGSGAARGLGNAGIGILIFIVVYFVSILIHELGHALVMRMFGEFARIVLYWNGGLAISDGGGGGSLWRLPQAGRGRSPQEQILVSLAGPAAGFLLAGLILAIVAAFGGQISARFHWVPIVLFDFQGTAIAGNEYLKLALYIAFYINLYMNLFNLLPVYPLDGGQITRGIYVQSNPWNGVKYSLFLSLVVAVVVAVLFWQNGGQFGALLFAMLAIQNFQDLQMQGMGGWGGGRPW